DAALAFDLREIADAAEKIVRDARRAAAAPGDFIRAAFFNFDVQQARRTNDDFFQLFRVIVIKAFTDREASKQRRGEQTAASGRADEREAWEVEPDAAGVRALVDDDIQFEILHGGIQI